MTVINENDKSTIINQLRLAHLCSQKLSMLLWFQGRADQAEQVEDETRELIKTICGLQTQSLDHWPVDTARMRERLVAVRGELQGAMEGIHSSGRVSNCVTTALGKLHEMVGTGRSMVAEGQRLR